MFWSHRTKRVIVIKYFMKLNIMSMIYAIMLSIEVQLLVNIYRISRIVGGDVSFVANLVYTLIFIVFILFTVLLVFLNKRYFIISKLKLKLVTVILWIPYFVLINSLFNYFFPISNKGDSPTPFLGLMGIIIIIIHFILVVLLNLLTLKKQ
ncbi:hypothetical protein D3C78_875380 [compost metagenome]